MVCLVSFMLTEDKNSSIIFMQCIKRWIMEEGKKLRKLRESTGMNRREFCEYFEIPYMTETDWELGNRRMPRYLLRLMEYKVHMEKLEYRDME